MNAHQFMAGLTLTTRAALKSGDISLPEIIGCLEMTKINAERLAFEASQNKSPIQPAQVLPPNGVRLPETPRN